MKNKFYLILIPLFLTLLACEETYQEHEKVKPQNQMSSKEVPKITLEKALPISKELTPTFTTKEIVPKKTIPKEIIPIEYHYEFKNLKNQVSTLHIKNDIYDFKNIKQSIVIVNIMSTWCPPCRGQIPHLSKLQQKFKENVFVMSTLVHDDISTQKLDKFIIAQKILFYVSITQDENLKFIDMIIPKLGLSPEFPMPLTIVFVRGQYFTHYEGMIPEEMIESDIKQLLEKIKK